VAALLLAIYFRRLNENNLVGVVTTAALTAAVAYFITMLKSRTVSKDEKRRVIGFIPIFLASLDFS
jgi:POT family proton-dependent oligopeptide transporter